MWVKFKYKAKSTFALNTIECNWMQLNAMISEVRKVAKILIKLDVAYVIFTLPQHSILSFTCEIHLMMLLLFECLFLKFAIVYRYLDYHVDMWIISIIIVIHNIFKFNQFENDSKWKINIKWFFFNFHLFK